MIAALRYLRERKDSNGRALHNSPEESGTKMEMAMEPTTLTPDLTVEAVLERWPQTVPVFQEFKTDCVGCSMAPFDTLEDVARIYNLELAHILDALRQKIEKTT